MHWLNGKKLQETSAFFDLRDRGLLLGDGVFDTSLVLNGETVFKEHHLERLLASCDFLGLTPDRSALASTIDIAASEVGKGALRVTVTRGSGPRGLLPQPDAKPTILVSTSAGLSEALWQPISAQISTTRKNETSITSQHKCLAYMDAIHALRIAAESGFNDVVFLNTGNHVTCCSTGNLFILSGKTLATPPVSDGVLPGITRMMLLDLAAQVGLTAIETSLTVEHVTAADAVFMSNSLRLISPVELLDNARLSTSGYTKLAELAGQLLERIETRHGMGQLIGNNSAEWLVTT